MDLDTADPEVLREIARALRNRVTHLEEHCAYMARCFAAERLHEVEPKTAAEIEAHRSFLQARIARAEEHHGRLAEGKSRDVAALAALPPPPEPDPLKAPSSRKPKGGGGGGGEETKRSTRPAARRVQRKGA